MYKETNFCLCDEVLTLPHQCHGFFSVSESSLLVDELNVSSLLLLLMDAAI